MCFCLLMDDLVGLLIGELDLVRAGRRRLRGRLDPLRRHPAAADRPTSPAALLTVRTRADPRLARVRPEGSAVT
jgi:hypothetical protein